MKNIVTHDSRWLKDVEPINLQVEDCIFYDLKINGNSAWDILDMIKWDMRFVHKDTKKVPFTDSIEIYDMAGNYFVVEYQSEEQRNNDIQGLKDNFSYDKKEIFAEKIIEDWAERQVPDYKGRFEYNGKYYIIVWALNKLTWETTSEKGIYKGVILSPDSYYWADKKIQNTQEWIWDNVKGIIGNQEDNGNKKS